MPTPATPLFFPQALKSPGLWRRLGQTHGLTQKDFEWFSHLQLANHTLRGEQKPPMLAEKILLKTNNLEPMPLAGSFVLSATPDDNGVILYTPYGGIKKYDSHSALTEQLKRQLNSATEDDDLLAFMSLSQRRTLADAATIEVTFQTIEGEVFEDQSSTITALQQMNDQAMLGELKASPSLISMLDTVLDELLKSAFPGLDQRQTQVSFYSTATADEHDKESTPARRWINAMSLSDAVLLYYRNQRWPSGQSHEFSHPKKHPASTDQQHWDTALATASKKLISLLSAQLQDYWNAASADGASRREFFSKAIAEKARADFLLKREAEIITPEQSQDLHSLIEPTSRTYETLTVETVRLWEYQANYVELAGSLMINGGNAFLYTPTQGLQVLKDYQDLKNTLLSKFSAAGHEDEFYGLLSLEERQRFIGFDWPNVSGEAISGSIFKKMFEAIITKQQQNIEYALQVFRHSDGIVDINALFDKALDIRSMISEQLLTLDTQGRWSTRPVLSGNQQPSMVLADNAAAFVKTFSDIEALISTDFASQPIASLALQRVYLENMKPRLAHALSVGIRGEASLRVLDATLGDTDRAIVDTVLNPDHSDRKSRLSLRGFRPDAYSLTLERSGQTNFLPLANCLLLTERGGLDSQHSGRTVLWTPAQGLEVFDTVSHAKQELDRRLLDPHKRLALLENLSPVQRTFHQRYSLGALRLIEGHVLQRLSQSSVDHFLGRCEHLRALKLDDAKQTKALQSLKKTVVDTNLRRATSIAQAITRQQSLPAWFAMAPVEEQQLHIELLEQYCNSVDDDKDYLHGMKTLRSYVHDTLVSLLGSRFSGTLPDPDDIEITPNLTLAGPARSLTEFALNHVNVVQGTGFKITSKTTQLLPQGLDQSAVRQLLLSLNIQQTYAKRMTDSLSNNSANADARRLRFIRQLPWQLMQHAHAQKLQQRISDSGFDLIRQVMDMPDAIARAAVNGAHAIVRPLELIKTVGAAAVKTLGLYLIGPGSGQKGPQILYAPFHADSLFTEFDNEASVISALNTPGPLQELLIRRLPAGAQSGVRNLLKSTIGQASEITLASNSIDGNLLTRLFRDNIHLLSQMLGTQSDVNGQSDWEAAKHLFSSGIHRLAGLLPGKLSYGLFLWQAYKDFKASAEAQQNRHWKQAVLDFIAGAVQMVSLGRLSLEESIGATQTTTDTLAEPVATPVAAPHWSQVKSTAPMRTSLLPFETTAVELKDLKKNSANGTYLEMTSKQTYAPIAGKVYRVTRPGAIWRMIKDKEEGPALLTTPDKQLVLDPDIHTVHYGKALSKMHNKFAASLTVRAVLNIEARGMEEIRTKHPEKARMIVKAIDLARYYAFNSLHNLVQLRHLNPGTRLDTFLKAFFDIDSLDASTLEKIKKVIVPICNALVDPNEDLMNTEHFVVGSNKDWFDGTIAFVMDGDIQKRVHFTERFFDPQLDWYKCGLTGPFDVDDHARAITVIHEFSHLFSKTVDIATLEARRPFTDLIATVTSYGATTKQKQQDLQRQALSLATPREELFARWNDTLQSWISLDSIEGLEHVGKDILKTTGCTTMNEARNAFRNPVDANLRIDTILRNADSIALLISEMGRQLDPVPVP
ncbi:dermonecrotic toxin domain-containing protein [Pseudomonas lini]|uniref:dermonecrotic toxin domain-containing protein n=1 Tax=Pseudomonas lini TaxID=163011 RepID=UPI00345EBFFC